MNDWLKARYADAKLAYAALMKFYPFTVDDLDGEVWKWIPNYEGLYQISSFGRVKSFQNKQVKINKPNLSVHGYLQAALRKDNRYNYFLVSRLVATCFIPNPKNLPQVDHADAHKFNNHISNLEWVTGFENQRRAVITGAKPSGENSHKAKLTNEQVIYIRENHDGFLLKQLAEKFNVTETTISEIQLGKTFKSTGGNVRKAKNKRTSDETRSQIRIDYNSGTYSQRALSEKYGLDERTIRRIVNGR